MNLDTGLYGPYKKENNTIQYINTKSNHPKSVINSVPKTVNDRLTRNSANEEVFNSAKQPYQDALDQSGYKHKLKFDPVVQFYRDITM